MKPAREWAKELQSHTIRPGVEPTAGRAGEPTVRVDGTFLHSQYRPMEEGIRLIDSAGLEPDRPVIVIGVGLGYHVLALAERGFGVIAIEPDASVAKLAVDGLLADSEALVWVGSLEAV
ncbi:MAG: hypothetical protein KJ060_13445 [Candidatus Hydrogenedentes bacterium]|nr:hypothetical protein [Candidatus Hydrogenedentota bacterium]